MLSNSSAIVSSHSGCNVFVQPVSAGWSPRRRTLSLCGTMFFALTCIPSTSTNSPRNKSYSIAIAFIGYCSESAHSPQRLYVEQKCSGRHAGRLLLFVCLALCAESQGIFSADSIVKHDLPCMVIPTRKVVRIAGWQANGAGACFIETYLWDVLEGLLKETILKRTKVLRNKWRDKLLFIFICSNGCKNTPENLDVFFVIRAHLHLGKRGLLGGN